jgi:hypothetical protein
MRRACVTRRQVGDLRHRRREIVIEMQPRDRVAARVRYY